MTAVVRPDAQAARQLTDRIKVAVEGTWHLITEAYESRAWSVLGYASWDVYCIREFGSSRLRLPREERAETVQSLRESGLSLRAIAAATGDSKDTVARALRPVSDATADQPPASDDDEVLTEEQCEAIEAERTGQPVKIVGVDGKSYSGRSAGQRTRRKPIADEMFHAVRELQRAVGRIDKLSQDDRFERNAGHIALRDRSDLIRARDALQRVVDQLAST